MHDVFYLLIPEEICRTSSKKAVFVARFIGENGLPHNSSSKKIYVTEEVCCLLRETFLYLTRRRL